MATSTRSSPTRPTKPRSLRDLRLDRGWNRSEFARALKVGRVTVWRWESGEHGLNMRMCKKVADLLGVSMEEVLQAAEVREAS